MSVPSYETDILTFWDKEHIYEHVKKQNATGKPFYLMDGPPYATGHIHMGTALNKILKDVALRSQRMQGNDVFDRPGYDTHGLPIEFQVEKEIGSKSKQDIEAYGVQAFIDKCRTYATRYIEVMNNEFKNIGVWMDWSNPYKTLTDEYIEAIWAVLKKAHLKKLLYLGSYPVHVCPRCATAVAFNEIEYRVQKDTAVYVKFPLKERPTTFLLIWTTTPWTLPSNTGVMIHPDIKYSEVNVDDERWIIASDLVAQCMKELGRTYTPVKEWKGSELVGLRYENPVARHTNLIVKRGYVIVPAPRYVTTTEGTGLVHCAPGHGKEDYDIGMYHKLDKPCPVGIDGIFGPEAGKYAGKRARQVDREIIDDLAQDGFLAYEHIYAHDYPLCWRCKTPLLMVSQPQWFLRISKIHKKLLAENEKVHWVPKWAQARMRAWIEGISDWPISRERYWGTPLPIWQCDDCPAYDVLGSKEELHVRSKKKTIDMHKPGIDTVTVPCSCGGTMHRVTSVFDVWFDSGASSWAALGYPSHQAAFKRYWPADLNIEGTDQFRGWWNSQLILSLIGFGKKPYTAISVHGMVLDLNKTKMSKSQGNIVSPRDVIATHGRDYLRYYLVKFSRGEDFSYSEKEFTEISKFFTILGNINTFTNTIEPGKKARALEDTWILSRYASTVETVTRAYNEFKFYAALDALERFVIEDVSRTYIQLIRDRTDEIGDTLCTIRNGILQLLAPIAPFVSERFWLEMHAQKRVDEMSVHLSRFPTVKGKNASIEQAFTTFRGALESGMAERDTLKMGLKWPLASATVSTPLLLGKEFTSLVKRQLNVKKVTFTQGSSYHVSYDTTMTPELEAEGYAREIMRRVQAERKKRGLSKQDRITLTLIVSTYLAAGLKSFTQAIADKTGAIKLVLTSDGKGQETFAVRSESVGISF